MSERKKKSLTLSILHTDITRYYNRALKYQISEITIYVRCCLNKQKDQQQFRIGLQRTQQPAKSTKCTHKEVSIKRPIYNHIIDLTILDSQILYKMNISTILILSAIFIAACAQNPAYRKVVHGTDPQARCLDGSAAAIYLSEGDPKNILMYFMGGASCGATDLSQTIESCYQRSKIHLGSSLYWPENNQFQGILSNEPHNNIFANWTKAVFLYCDGAFHQGNAKAPIKYKDTTLYFRGGVITRSHLTFMNSRYPFQKAEKIVLTGSSAGGMATFIWADYVKAMVGANTQFYSIPDSGIFLNPAEPLFPRKRSTNDPQASDAVQVLLSLANKDEGVPNSKCGAALGKQDQYKCLSIHAAYVYLQTESLFLQSSYDQYIIRYSAGYTCIKEGVSGFTLKDCDPSTMQVIEGYRLYYLQFLSKLLERGHNIWTISCAWHATSEFDRFYESSLQKVPQTSGNTMQQAVYNFVFENNKVVDIDIVPWPVNAACAY